MTPFPTCRSRVPNESYSLYCVCRMIDDGTPMIQCSSCANWLCLHGQTKDYNGNASLHKVKGTVHFIVMHTCCRLCHICYWILNHTLRMLLLYIIQEITWFYNACTAGYNPCNNSASSDNGIDYFPIGQTLRPKINHVYISFQNRAWERG